MIARGRGGTLEVSASDFIKLSGTSASNQLPSGLFAQTLGTGDAGSLTIATGQLIVRDKAQVTVSGIASGDAGTLFGTSSLHPARQRRSHFS